MPNTDTSKEYWQITHYYKNGDAHHCLKHSYDDAFKAYCDALQEITACDGDRLALYQVSADNFVTLWFTTTVG